MEDLARLREILDLLGRELQDAQRRQKGDEAEIARVQAETKRYAALLQEKQRHHWRSQDEARKMAEEHKRSQDEARKRDEEHKRSQDEARKRAEEHAETARKAQERVREEWARQEKMRKEQADRDREQQRNQNFKRGAEYFSKHQQQAEKKERGWQQYEREGEEDDWLKKQQQSDTESRKRTQNAEDYDANASARNEQYVWWKENNFTNELGMLQRYKDLMHLVGMDTSSLPSGIFQFMADLKHKIWPELRKKYLKWLVGHKDSWGDSASEHYEEFLDYQETFSHLDKKLFPAHLSCILELLEFRAAALRACF